MSTINFNDAVFAQDFMEAFVEYITPIKAFATDFSSYAEKPGNAIYIPRVDAVTATTFSYNNNSGFPYEGSDGTVNVITVNLNNQYVQSVDITDLQAANSSAAKMENFVRQQANVLATKFLQTVWSLITPANGSVAVTTAAANWSKTQVRAMRLKLKQNKAWDDTGMALICDSTIEDYLLGDSNITQVYQYGGSEAIRDGRVPRLMGFDVYASNIIPSNSISLIAFGCNKAAIATAMRYLAPQDPGAYAAAMPVTDPSGSGITLGYRRHFNPGKGKHFANFEILFGYASGISTGLVIATVP